MNKHFRPVFNLKSLFAVALVHFCIWHHCSSLSRDLPVSFWPAQGRCGCSMALPALAWYVCCRVACHSSSLLCPSYFLQSHHLHVALYMAISWDTHLEGCKLAPDCAVNPVATSCLVVRGWWLLFLCWSAWFWYWSAGSICAQFFRFPPFLLPCTICKVIVAAALSLVFWHQHL